MKYGDIAEWRTNDGDPRDDWIMTMFCIGEDDEGPLWLTLSDTDPDVEGRWEPGMVSHDDLPGVIVTMIEEAR